MVFVAELVYAHGCDPCFCRFESDRSPKMKFRLLLKILKSYFIHQNKKDADEISKVFFGAVGQRQSQRT